MNSLLFSLHMRSLSVYLQSNTFNSCSIKILWALDIRRSGASVIGIERVVHLRYLAISSTTEFPQVESFRKLEFLVTDGLLPIEILEILLNMVSFRGIYSKSGTFFSESCHQQATKDESFQIDSNLQIITMLAIRDETDEKILRCLRNLRRLTIWFQSSLDYSSDAFN